jgi:DNA replication protein DnaC
MKPATDERRAVEVHSSWPSKHLRRIPTMHGRSLVLAQKLAPKITEPRFFVMAGGRGVGKTQVATYLAHSRAKRGFSSGIYTRARDMIAAIVGFDREEKLRKYQRASFLIIDECHRIQPADIPTLESIVDDRYANERTTGMIGNWQSVDGIHLGENIENEQLSGIGSSLFNRLQEHQRDGTGGVVWCKWESYRAA